MSVLRSVLHRVRAVSIARLLIAVVALSPVIERAVPDACDADGRALQTRAVTAAPDDGTNGAPAHNLHLCHCAHTHAQAVTDTGGRPVPAVVRGRGFPRHASGLGRMPDAPPARPPAVA